jgi:hypothetical protein
MPNVSHTSTAFIRLLESIERKGLQVNTAQAGVTILSLPELQIDIVAPVRNDYTNLNDHSAVIKLTYGTTSFLFASGAGTLSEEHITADVSTNVLKLGNHGSQASTSVAFLNRVNSDYAVISVGQNNFGHPSDEVLSRLGNRRVYRTDMHGTIVFASNGSGFVINTERTPDTTNNAQDNNDGFVSIGGNQYAKNTTYLELIGELAYSDFMQIQYLTDLTFLVMGQNNISNLTPLAGLTNLIELLIVDNNVSDLTPLAGLTNLRFLRLDSNRIIDVAPLAGLTNLDILYLGDNRISDITPLAKLVFLKELDLRGNNITDWSPVSHIENVHGRP